LEGRRVNAVFVELPAFERHRATYFDDEGLSRLQRVLMEHPEAGAVIAGTGGLRKIRVPDERRSRGSRSGLRVVYYWWSAGLQFWLFTVYGKDEMSDLTPAQKRALKALIKHELEARRRT